MQTIDPLPPVAPLQLFKKADAPGQIAKDSSGPADSEQFSRIRCPRCQWHPDASSTWVCWNGDGPEPPFEACGTFVEYVRDGRALSGLRASMAVDVVLALRSVVAARGLVRGADWIDDNAALANALRERRIVV